jgi:hypothetical protein
MERQDRLLPTPMPPEEKQALRTKAKEDMVRGLGLLGTDILGAGGDIAGLISKFLPMGGGQTLDDLYKTTKKPSEMLEQGIGSEFFQKAFDIKPTGSFAENLTRIGGSVVPISGSGIVNTLKTPGNLASKMRQSMITPEGIILKMDDVPRTTGEILMTEGTGSGGIKPKPQKINIDTKIRDKDEVTFGSALSADKSIYSRLVYDLENTNKPGGMSFPKEGTSAQDAINILSKRPTFAEAQESGLLAYLQRQVDKGSSQPVTQDDLLRVARAYKPNINKRVYSRNEFEEMRKDTSWADNMDSEKAAEIMEDYDVGIANYNQQTPYNLELVATDYKIIHFNDPTEPIPGNKLLNDTYLSTKLRGLDSTYLPQGFHDYGESTLNPGYFGHIRNADVKLDPKLNDGLSDGVIAIEHQMNLAGNKDLNQSLLSLPERVTSQKNKVDVLQKEVMDLDAKLYNSISYEEKRLGRTLNAEELDRLDNYKNSSEFKAERDKLNSLKDRLDKEKATFSSMQSNLQRGKAGGEVVDGQQVYDAKKNPKFLNILTNEDRVYIDEIAEIDKKNNIGFSTFKSQKKNIIDEQQRLSTEQEKLYKDLDQYEIVKEETIGQSLAADNAVGFLSRKKIGEPEDLASPFTVYDARGKAADNPYFEMFVDTEKGGASKDFIIKLARNQLDDTPNNIIDLEKKTATMDLGFFDRVKGVRKDNKQLVSNTMKSEAKNYFETQQLTTEFVEKIRNHPNFSRNFDNDTITNLKNRLLNSEKGSDEYIKAKTDLNIAVSEAMDDTGLDLNKLAKELVERSIKENRQIPAFSPQLSKNPVLHKQQAITDLVESITNPTIIRVPGTKQKVNPETGRPLMNTRGRIMEDIEFDASINSMDSLNIMRAKLGKNAYDEEMAFLDDKIKIKQVDIDNLTTKLDNEYNKKKFVKLSQELRKKLTDKKQQDVFIRTMKHEAEEMEVPISKEPLFKNAPFPNLKKASQFLARSNIEQAIENGKEFIAFPSRNDYALRRQRKGPGEFESVFGKNLDEILKEYVRKGAVLKNQVISAADKATISNKVGNDPMRVLDIRPLLGKKKEAIPRMKKGGFFEKFRKAG